jgi:D-alanyl-D-alanine carboxypeptidase
MKSKTKKPKQKVEVNDPKAAAIARSMLAIKDQVPLPYQSASCWAVYDANSVGGSLQMITGKREKERREVASMTKMMTFYTSYLLFKKYRHRLPDEPTTTLPFWIPAESEEAQNLNALENKG